MFWWIGAKKMTRSTTLCVCREKTKRAVLAIIHVICVIYIACVQLSWRRLASIMEKKKRYLFPAYAISFLLFHTENPNTYSIHNIYNGVHSTLYKFIYDDSYVHIANIQRHYRSFICYKYFTKEKRKKLSSGLVSTISRIMMCVCVLSVPRRGVYILSLIFSLSAKTESLITKRSLRSKESEKLFSRMVITSWDFLVCAVLLLASIWFISLQTRREWCHVMYGMSVFAYELILYYTYISPCKYSNTYSGGRHGRGTILAVWMSLLHTSGI